MDYVYSSLKCTVLYETITVPFAFEWVASPGRFLVFWLSTQAIEFHVLRLTYPQSSLGNFLLVVVGDGSIVKMSFLRSVTEGGNVAFGCVDGRTNKPVNVLRWEHNEKPIRPCSRVRISPPGTYHKLLIRPALMSDAGRYECVTEINGTVYRASRRISILAQGQEFHPYIESSLLTCVLCILCTHRYSRVSFQCDVCCCGS